MRLNVLCRLYIYFRVQNVIFLSFYWPKMWIAFFPFSVNLNDYHYTKFGKLQLLYCYLITSTGTAICIFWFEVNELDFILSLFIKYLSERLVQSFNWPLKYCISVMILKKVIYFKNKFCSCLRNFLQLICHTTSLIFRPLKNRVFHFLFFANRHS